MTKTNIAWLKPDQETGVQENGTDDQEPLPR